MKDPVVIPFLSRKRPVKLGEEVKNGGRLVGYVRKVVRLGGNRWGVLVSRS